MVKIIAVIIIFVPFVFTLPTDLTRSAIPNYLDGKRTRKICEPVKVAQCAEIGYKYTDPSLSPRGVFNQKHAEDLVNEYRFLSGTTCAEEVKMLICSIFVPVCLEEFDEFIPPCRFVCQRAKDCCLPMMTRYKYEWPADFNCSNFPEYTPNNQMCFHNNKLPRPTPSTQMTTNPIRIYTLTQPTTEAKTNQVLVAASTKSEKLTKKVGNFSKDEECKCVCTYPMVIQKSSHHSTYEEMNIGSISDCMMSCHSPFFSKTYEDFATSWLAAWSTICFSFTLFVVLTFLINTDMFSCSEKPVVYVSICYLFISVGYIIRFIFGHEAVACGGQSEYALHNVSGPSICSLVFTLTYFFFMAGTFWWVILSFTWFLLPGFNWTEDKIAKEFSCFHLIAWVLPATLTLIITVSSKIDGDSLSGSCTVGSQDAKSLRNFIIFPLVFCVFFSSIFLAIGVWNLYKNKVRNQCPKKENNEACTTLKLLGKVCMFFLIYMVPTGVLLGCYFYELQNQENWNISHNCHTDNQNTKCSAKNTPHLSVFVIKYVAIFVIGITNFIWICSRKTTLSWICFYRRFCSFYAGDFLVKKRATDHGIAAGTSADSSSLNSTEQSGEVFLTSSFMDECCCQYDQSEELPSNDSVSYVDACCFMKPIHRVKPPEEYVLNSYLAVDDKDKNNSYSMLAQKYEEHPVSLEDYSDSSGYSHHPLQM